MPDSPKDVPSDDGGASSDGSTKGQSDSSRTQASMRARKRTKTGCLTCRKRRIKCGEERPVCANCIKSKRSCEGYAPRLTFRDPVALGSGWAPRGIARLENPAGHLHPHIQSAQPFLAAQAGAASHSQFPVIAPRPTPPQMVPPYPPHHHDPSLWPGTPPLTSQTLYYSPSSHLAGPASAPYPSGAGPHPSAHPMLPRDAAVHARQATWPLPSDAEAYPPHPLSADAAAMLQSGEAYPGMDSHRYGGVQSAPPDALLGEHLGWPHASPAASHLEPSLMAPLAGSADFELASSYAAPEDDEYTADSDDLVPGPSGPPVSMAQHDYGLMLAVAASREDQAIRSYDAFLEKPDILATYVPNFSASPLMDHTTARIFCHFITATAPFLSIFERHPVNPYVLFSGKPVPRASQAVWTYMLPMLALRNQTLLQAMLGLASLQIARLQGTPPTASMRHYHFALRKVAKAVSAPAKRTSIPTLAATLLLGHYEATTAEHAKWSSHLAGARQLILEVDFGRTTRGIQRMRAREASSEPWQNAYVATPYQAAPSSFPWVPQPGSVAEQTVHELMGPAARFDAADVESQPGEAHFSEKDLEDFQVYRDLFWFYCKQDIIQSCISGNALLLPYERWMHCPPRGPIGKIDAVYGTMDHMLLLMGRVCHFAYSDQARKAQAQTARGGSWTTGSAAEAAMSAAGVPTYGMIPGVYPSALPEAFKDAPRDAIYDPPAAQSHGLELATATAEAEHEWHAIQAAFARFEGALGAAFQALPDDAAPTVETPFGRALHFRTYHIATIWEYYYTARIIAARTHPAMPPDAHAAAALAAPQTAPWTTAIARIALGLQPPPPDQPLNPSFGAALAESMLALFFAGVCYKSPRQRAATVQRLTLIADRAGVESAALVALGLERAWVAQAEAGRGPPYEKTVDLRGDYPAGDLLDSGSSGHDATLVHRPLPVEDRKWGKAGSGGVSAADEAEGLPYRML